MFGNSAIGLPQLIPAEAPGVLAVEQHVEGAAVRGSHLRAVAVKRAQFGGYRGWLLVARSRLGTRNRAARAGRWPVRTGRACRAG